MPETFLSKVKYLCLKIPHEEWSGPLFYSIEGSIEKPETFKIKLEDILPLDRGTGSFTSYELDDRFIEYMTEPGQEHRMDWKMGHIHSHNTMKVFFSGTDMAELNDNAPLHNFYLSLIVNDFMDFTAKIAFVVTATFKASATKFAKNENGADFKMGKANLTRTEQVLYVYNCLINAPIERLEVPEDFEAKVAEILKPKPVKTYYSASGNQGSYKQGDFYDKMKEKYLGDKPAKVVPLSQSTPGPKPVTDEQRAAFFKSKLEGIDLESPAESMMSQDLASFMFDWLSPDDTLQEFDEVFEALEEIYEDDYKFAGDCLESFPGMYNNAFPGATDKKFIEDTFEIIEVLEDYCMQFAILEPLKRGLSKLIVTYKKDVQV